jgi:hypothetical protein
VMRILRNLGFEMIRQKGSHYQFKHAATKDFAPFLHFHLLTFHLRTFLVP